MTKSRTQSPSLVLILTMTLASIPAWGDENTRTSWGDPKIEGLWDFRTITPFERPVEVADKAIFTPQEARSFRESVLAALDVDNRASDNSVDIEGAYNNTWYDWGAELTQDLRTSLIIDPPNGRLPKLTEQARKQMEQHNRLRLPPVRDLFSFSANPTTFRPAGPESLGLSERCLVGLNAGPPLSPSAYNNNLRIVQTPNYVLLVTEMIHSARIVPINGQFHLPEGLRQWSGGSIGYWEGDTLVVETKNFSDKTSTFQMPAGSVADATQSGAAGSAKTLLLIERFRNEGGSLIYQYTINHPSTFILPFTVEIPMRKSNARMYEYACHEGNYAMESMLKGARVLEAEAAKADLQTSGGH